MKFNKTTYYIPDFTTYKTNTKSFEILKSGYTFYVDFKLDEKPYQYLHNIASELIGHQLPPIAKRWSGVYSQRTDQAICDRRQIAPNIISVTGPGGRGNTLAPAIAEETIKGIA